MILRPEGRLYVLVHRDTRVETAKPFMPVEDLATSHILKLEEGSLREGSARRGILSVLRPALVGARFFNVFPNGPRRVVKENIESVRFFILRQVESSGVIARAKIFDIFPLGFRRVVGESAGRGVSVVLRHILLR